jgi:hypothetical protein
MSRNERAAFVAYLFGLALLCVLFLAPVGTR